MDWIMEAERREILYTIDSPPPPPRVLCLSVNEKFTLLCDNMIELYHIILGFLVLLGSKSKSGSVERVESRTESSSISCIRSGREETDPTTQKSGNRKCPYGNQKE
jgi:hypothetical protein